MAANEQLDDKKSLRRKLRGQGEEFVTVLVSVPALQMPRMLCAPPQRNRLGVHVGGPEAGPLPDVQPEVLHAVFEERGPGLFSK
jgi:hypothetical protein